MEIDLEKRNQELNRSVTVLAQMLEEARAQLNSTKLEVARLKRNRNRLFGLVATVAVYLQNRK